jgi:ferredoxin-type protein NapH
VPDQGHYGDADAFPGTIMKLVFWRRICQAIIALGFIVVPALNARGITVLSGNLLSLDFFGLTFTDPLALLQTLAGGRPGMRALTGAGLVLCVALVLGRVFCGWMCPYGLASELVFALRAKTRASGGAASRPETGASLRSFAGRAAVAGLGLAAVLLFAPEPWLNQLSMPGWYTRALQHAVLFGLPLYGALLFPALLLLEGCTARRVWCRWLCPQSVLLSLCAALPWPILGPEREPGLRLRFTRKKCSCARNDRPCLAACSLVLNPRAETLAQRLDCTNCGDCVDACQARGKALRLSLH